MRIELPKDIEKLKTLHAGDVVELTGVIYTSRDAAHLRMEQMIKNSEELPVDFNGAFIYYAGPTPTKPGHVVGSIGPTTSSRMDKFAYMMKGMGVTATIGKGPRSEECTKKYIEDGILYFITTGGCGALLAKSVRAAKEIAFFDLGPESIKRLEVDGFKMICAIDYYGNNIFNKENK